MALKKENYETIYGVNAEHWVIQGINANDQYGYADITLVGYVNQEAYEEKKASIETRKVKVSYSNGYAENFSKKAVIDNNSNIYELAYNYLKENNEFFMDC